MVFRACTIASHTELGKICESPIYVYVKHPYKTLKMSHIFYSYFIEDSCRAFIDPSFHIQSSSLGELFAKQSHFKVSRLL